MTEQLMPDMKTINGHTYVKVKDLADQWHTTTSHILRTGKPNQVPAKYRKTIEGRTWCDVEGLKARLNMMKRGGKIPSQLHQFLDRFPPLGFTLTGPLMETVHEKNGGTTTILRSTFQNIDAPSSEELQTALENRQIIYRYKNNRIQVLAQTLSNYLDTRTSSLLAMNKKQGVPAKFIHREWKRTWVDLEGLKQRVAHTEHGSALLKGLKQVIQCIDAVTTPDDQLVKTVKQSESANATKPEQKPSAPLGSKRNPIDPCEVAMKAVKQVKHNTERLNKLTRDEAALENLIFKYRDASSVDLYTQSKRLDMFADRLHRIEKGDKQAVQAMAEGKTPLDALSQRVSGIVTHADRLDTKTDGLVSRVSVLEDTSKWLSWSLAGVLSLRFLGLTLRLLRRK